MNPLGKPIRVCPEHIAALPCGCLGVELDEWGELKAATREGCAMCLRSQPNYFAVVRKCHRPRCYGRFHRISFDELHGDELVEATATTARRFVARLLRRAA